MQQTEFFVSLGHFLPFYFPNNLENQNFEVKRVSGDVIILHKWTIDDNHMMYGSWDEVQQTECFVILGHFLPFYFHNNPENQNFEKWKKHLEMSSFYTFVSQAKIIWCIVPEIWSATDRICATGFFVILGHFLPFDLTNNPKNRNLEKMEDLDISSSFYTSAPKIVIICYTILQISAWRV